MGIRSNWYRSEHGVVKAVWQSSGVAPWSYLNQAVSLLAKKQGGTANLSFVPAMTR